jgi:hypothetical protein
MGDQDLQRCKGVQSAITHFYGIHVCARIVRIKQKKLQQIQYNISQVFTIRTQ